MKNFAFIKNVLKLCLPILFLAFSVQSTIAQTITSNQTGTHNGWFYSFWTENANNGASMTLGAAGNYSTTWNNTLNFTAGKGWKTGSANKVVCFEGTYNGGSNGFLALYGWTKDPLIEYYVCEKHGQWEPPGNTSDISYKGTYTCDGGTYKCYTGKRVNKPSIIGTATFDQFWSVRTEQRSSGTITFANHIAAWKSFGMNMGTTWDYQIMESEGYNSSGSSNITISDCTTPTGPTVTLTAPTASTTIPVETSITLTATATVLAGSTVSKVEFFNGTTLLNSDASSPYSYVWTPTAAGTYTITAKVTDSGNKTATSSAVTVTVISPLKIYKSPVAITIDGTEDAIWTNASVLPATAAKTLSGTITNAADLSGTFKALWDNTYLYIFANISDESLKNESANTYDDDNVEIYIDADNTKAATYDANDVQYSFAWNDGTTIGTIPSTYSQTGISYSAVNKTGGYIVEARIPWATVGTSATLGKVIGIDFMINDDDDGSTRDAKLSWTAATDDAWQNPSLFGIAVLNDVIANPCTTPAAPTVNSPVSYPVGAVASPLTANGSNLLWYTTATGGTGSSTAPTPATTTIGSTTYYVSQSVSSCESPRTPIVVNIVSACTTPAAPTVTSPVSYTVGAIATPLTATGTNLLWYTTASGGTGSSTAPTPVTTSVGTTTYYVTQTSVTCESSRASIVVNIVPVVKPSVQLKAGWNMIGYPYTESKDVETALSSILSDLETVKDFDGFWSKDNNPILNSLPKLEYGRGYFVKVSRNCSLTW